MPCVFPMELLRIGVPPARRRMEMRRKEEEEEEEEVRAGPYASALCNNI